MTRKISIKNTIFNKRAYYIGKFVVGFRNLPDKIKLILVVTGTINIVQGCLQDVDILFKFRFKIQEGFVFIVLFFNLTINLATNQIGNFLIALMQFLTVFEFSHCFSGGLEVANKAWKINKLILFPAMIYFVEVFNIYKQHPDRKNHILAFVVTVGNNAAFERIINNFKIEHQNLILENL